MNRLFLIAALAAAAYFTFAPDARTPVGQEPAATHAVALETQDSDAAALETHGSDDAALENAFANRLSNLQIEGQGTVVKILPDDNNDSRHQRIIIRLESGQTLLLAHNIDLAQRIDTLRAGDIIAFYGEYEWSPKGGVIHWTHHDPQGRHPAGWIRHDGQTYQ
jgi:hypothetical protein